MTPIDLRNVTAAFLGALLAFVTPGFLTDQAWGTQVNVETSCEQLKKTCPKSGYFEGPADDHGYRACTCFTPCGGKAEGCDVQCRARPGEIVSCTGHTPIAKSLGNPLTLTPAQILGTTAHSPNAPAIMRRGVEGEQPATPTPSEPSSGATK